MADGHARSREKKVLTACADGVFGTYLSSLHQLQQPCLPELDPAPSFLASFKAAATCDDAELLEEVSRELEQRMAEAFTAVRSASPAPRRTRPPDGQAAHVLSLEALQHSRSVSLLEGKENQYMSREESYLDDGGKTRALEGKLQEEIARLRGIHQSTSPQRAAAQQETQDGFQKLVLHRAALRRRERELELREEELRQRAAREVEKVRKEMAERVGPILEAETLWDVNEEYERREAAFDAKARAALEQQMEKLRARHEELTAFADRIPPPELTVPRAEVEASHAAKMGELSEELRVLEERERWLQGREETIQRLVDEQEREVAKNEKEMDEMRRRAEMYLSAAQEAFGKGVRNLRDHAIHLEEAVAGNMKDLMDELASREHELMKKVTPQRRSPTPQMRAASSTPTPAPTPHVRAASSTPTPAPTPHVRAASARGTSPSRTCSTAESARDVSPLPPPPYPHTAHSPVSRIPLWVPREPSPPQPILVERGTQCYPPQTPLRRAWVQTEPLPAPSPPPSPAPQPSPVPDTSWIPKEAGYQAALASATNEINALKRRAAELEQRLEQRQHTPPTQHTPPPRKSPEEDPRVAELEEAMAAHSASASRKDAQIRRLEATVSQQQRQLDEAGVQCAAIRRHAAAVKERQLKEGSSCAEYKREIYHLQKELVALRSQCTALQQERAACLKATEEARQEADAARRWAAHTQRECEAERQLLAYTAECKGTTEEFQRMLTEVREDKLQAALKRTEATLEEETASLKKQVAVLKDENSMLKASFDSEIAALHRQYDLQIAMVSKERDNLLHHLRDLQSSTSTERARFAQNEGQLLLEIDRLRAVSPSRSCSARSERSYTGTLPPYRSPSVETQRSRRYGVLQPPALRTPVKTPPAVSTPPQ